MEVVITKDNFEAEVLKSDKPVLVDFFLKHNYFAKSKTRRI